MKRSRTWSVLAGDANQIFGTKKASSIEPGGTTKYARDSVCRSIEVCCDCEGVGTFLQQTYLLQIPQKSEFENKRAA